MRASVERHKGRLSSEFTLARLRRKAPSLELLRQQVEKAAAGEEAEYPRWVRINALKSSLEDELETTFATYTRAESVQDVVTKDGKHIYIDPHVPNLVATTPRIDLTKTSAYAAGKIILQDKASCFPAYLLDPRSEDGDVVDACAAPGNKTTHLAAILHEHRPEFEAPPQTIYAFEKDTRRAQTLEKMVKIAGSKNATRIGFGQDFLQVDPRSERFQRVGALLLDPSCSGSGIVGRDSMPELHLPDSADSRTKASSNAPQPGKRKRKHGEVEPDAHNILRDDDGNETVVGSEKDLDARLEALASFQLSLLLHAFRFPGATKVTYSTCSIHAQENEHVVIKALQSDIGRERGWRVLARKDQVSGMREWDVRGEADACDGDAEVADACIRSYKADGRGIMGFFVAAFERSRTEPAADGVGDEGPYLRDENGAIVRDVLGMPALKSTGAPVAFESREDEFEEEDESESDDSSNSGSASESDDHGGASEIEDEDEWDGLGD